MKLLDWIPLDELNWSCLSSNINVINMLEQNMNKINWSNWNNLSLNLNAIHLLEKNMDKINWSSLALNLNAIYLLEQNMHKIYWKWFFTNPSIFEIDKKQLKIDIEKQANIIDKIIYE